MFYGTKMKQKCWTF